MIVAQKNKLSINEEDKGIVDKLSYHSARLYNSCVYNIRQYYFDNNAYLPFKQQYHYIKENENFRLLINDSAQQILRMVDKNFRSFFSLLKLKQRGKYSDKVKIPGYLDKEKGWSIFFAGRCARIKNGNLHIGLSKAFREQYNIHKKEIVLPLPGNLKNIEKLQQLQIKPLYDGKEYEIIYTYEREEQKTDLNKNNYIGIDCGLDNLMTIYDPQKGSSFIIDGKPIKSINHYYNKKKAKLQSEYERNKLENNNTNKYRKLCEYRKNYINNYFNQSINNIINYCLENDIGNIIIGDFSRIKQNINIGKKNNQNFVSIPYGILKQKLEAKCSEYGINYVLQDESYSSKCSAFDREEIEKKDKYNGKRVKRGLFKTKNGELVNADVNGACNIIRKYLKSKSGSDLSDTDVSGAVNHPERIPILQSP